MNLFTIFIYRVYSTRHHWLDVSVFGVQTCLKVVLDLRGSSGEDERPTTGRFNSEDWVGSLHDYLTSATDRHPGDLNHPSGDWFGQGVELAALDQGRAVTSTPKQALIMLVDSN